MSAVGPLEYRKDILGERFYASRNYNDLSQTYRVPGSNRTQLDWNMTLRQRRKIKTDSDTPLTRSEPNLATAEMQRDRDLEPLVAEHEDGPYHSTTETIGKYQNFAATHHMLNRLNRVSSSSLAHTVDWQLNLRDGHHQKPDDKWRRYFTRPQKTFDLMLENCGSDNEAYKTSKITPQDRRPDRRSGAISIETIRDEPMDFRRNPGCEGTQVGQWEHLITCQRYGRKARKQLAHETTLRVHTGDTNGARIDDSRSDGCIVEMLGKKRSVGGVSRDAMSQQPPYGDPKLYHLSRTWNMSEEDEDNRGLRKNKQTRSDANMSYKHTGATRKKPKDDEGGL